MDVLRNNTVVVACGVGRDSTGMLVGLHERGIRPDAVVFADVGAEKQGTYDFIPHLQAWLASVEFPGLTIVRYVPKKSPYTTIEGNMVANATLPGATFGMGSCTMKWKIEPQLRWGKQSSVCQAAWAAGRKVIKLIGFEASEGYRQQRASDKAHTGKGSVDGDKYEVLYPLMDWGWTLERCKQAIDDVGMPLPPKSACFFCPNQQPEEVYDLSDEDRAKIIRMEITAEPFNRKVHGLWRRPRKTRALPGSITEYILAQRLPFVPLETLKPIPANPACGKSDRGFTFQPPHLTDSLRAKVEAEGHVVPNYEDEFHRELTGWLF